MRDFLPADVRKREYVIGIVKEVYESHGFEPLETPAVENLETLMGKYGDEGNQLIFRILKRGEKLDASEAEFSPAIRKALEASATMSIYGKSILSAVSEAFKAGEIDAQEMEAINEVTRLFVDAIGTYRNTHLADLALRYDLTVPLARVVANRKNDIPKFFKRYQIQPVWRADRPARGRFREFWQCDVDVIGSSSMVVEAELISAVSEILKRLEFNDFVVRVNHRKVLSGLLSVWVKDEVNHIPVLVALDKLDKIGSEGVMVELREIGLAEEDAEGLLGIFDLTQKQISAMTRDPYIHQAILDMLDEHVGKESDVGRAGIADLRHLASLLSSSSIDTDWRIDASLARGLSYYTGTIIEVNVPDLGGSLGGGGRYDGLIGMFGKEQIPACGFSLGLERILVVMEERGMFPPEIAESTPADVMVTIWSEETIAESLKLANELRQLGIRVTVYPEPDKLGKQIKYADLIQVPWVCVLGDTELAEGKVTLKNMRTGEQQTLERSAVAKALKR